MFSLKDSTNSVLLCGPTIYTRSFLFETAIHWAEEGLRVIYIAPAPLTSIPAKYHDREKTDPQIFEMMKFMYMKNYETLVEQLVDLHTFATLPSVLLIDSLDTFTCDPIQEQDMHVARLCAIIHDSMNACSRIHKSKVYIGASVSSTNLTSNVYIHYFSKIWSIKKEDDEEEIDMRQISGSLSSKNIFKYRRLKDGTMILIKTIKECGSST